MAKVKAVTTNAVALALTSIAGFAEKINPTDLIEGDSETIKGLVDGGLADDNKDAVSYYAGLGSKTKILVPDALVE